MNAEAAAALEAEAASIAASVSAPDSLPAIPKAISTSISVSVATPLDAVADEAVRHFTKKPILTLSKYQPLNQHAMSINVLHLRTD